MTDIRYIYVTTKSLEEARKIAEACLKDRLVACANIIPEMESMYWWQGQIQYAAEAVLVLKTTVELVERATVMIKLWHSYSTPCILTIPIESGDAPYINWLQGEVSKA